MTTCTPDQLVATYSHILSKIKSDIDQIYDDNIGQYQMIDPKELKLDNAYQRHVSTKALTSNGPLDMRLFQTISVCKRPDEFGPDGGFFIVDGQHRFIRALNELDRFTLGIPCQVHEHDKSMSISECVQYEANLFKTLNTSSLKANQVDQVRAGVIAQHADDLTTLDAMKTLNFYNDNFGSDRPGAKLIHPFGNFYNALWKDYKHGQTSQLKYGLELYHKCYAIEEVVNSVALRAFSYIGELHLELTNGKQEEFYKFVIQELPRQVKTVKQFCNGHGGFSAPKYILHEVISRYNAWQETKGHRIGDTLLDSIYLTTPRLSPPALK